MEFVVKHWKTVLIGTSAIALTAYLVLANYPKPTKSTSKSKKKHNNQASLSTDSNATLATKAKDKGNSLYKEKNYKLAIDKYSEAIELDSTHSIYYSNRAACYNHLKEYEKVVQDCTSALKIEPAYVKALNRRATAYEALGKLQESLQDFTALCVLEGFKNESTVSATDRVLKTIGKEKAALMILDKPQTLPSDIFINAYMESFSATSTKAKHLFDDTPATNASDEKVKQAFECVVANKHLQALKLTKEALDSNDLSKPYKIWALNLSGTFNFLKGNVDAALKDFNTCIDMDPKNIDTLVKRASVYMEKGEVAQTISEFTHAEKIMNESNIAEPDLYYHRGQVRHLTGDLENAIVDFQKCLSLNPTFVYAHIQLGVAQYKTGDITTSIETFKEAAIAFPDRSEVYNYQGEILLDQGNHEKAMENFDKSIEIQPKSSLPYINKAMLYLQTRGDPNTAEKLFKKAIEVDPQGDIAYGPLAQLYLSQQKVAEAVATYDQAIKVSRTEAELVTAISCREAAIAQIKMQELYPELMQKFMSQ